MPNTTKYKNNQTAASDMDSYQVRTLQKKRTTNFREDETKLLISLWGSPVIQNKLYLTHRKAPVMRLLAANMQQRGFYRSPDEIKTRIRNLKCLYHRIKRTMVTGSGIGTVDPDWPHFKAMDAILGKENANKEERRNKTTFKDETTVVAENTTTATLEGPRCEDIKQELDINDDMESWNGNDSLGGSDFDDNHVKSTIPTTTTTTMTQETKLPTLPTLLPNITIPTSTQRPNGTIPLPLLILNHGIHSQSFVGTNEHKNCAKTNNNNDITKPHNSYTETSTPELANILREILNVQNQQLQLEKQKFELEKQRLEFDRVVGSQLMTLVPMVGGLLQRLVYPSSGTVQQTSEQHPQTSPMHNSVADAADSAISCDDNEAESKQQPIHQHDDYDILKDSKILRTVLERGIKKYMMADETRDKDDDSDNDDRLNDDEHNLLIDNDNSNSNSK